MLVMFVVRVVPSLVWCLCRLWLFCLNDLCVVGFVCLLLFWLV